MVVFSFGELLTPLLKRRNQYSILFNCRNHYINSSIGQTASFSSLLTKNRLQVAQQNSLLFHSVRFHNRGSLVMLRSCSHFANKPSKKKKKNPADDLAHLGVKTVEKVVLFQCCLDCFYTSVFPVSESSMQNLTFN